MKFDIFMRVFNIRSCIQLMTKAQVSFLSIGIAFYLWVGCFSSKVILKMSYFQSRHMTN